MKQQRTKCNTNQHQKRGSANRNCVRIWITSMDEATKTVTLDERWVSKEKADRMQKRDEERRQQWLQDNGLRLGETRYIESLKGYLSGWPQVPKEKENT